jgi:hypothetical protein
LLLTAYAHTAPNISAFLISTGKDRLMKGVCL